LLRFTRFLSKIIISEEAVVRKAGGKFKMNPMFPSTVAKIQAVRILFYENFIISTDISSSI
jgi:hypothetical protein